MKSSAERVSSSSDLGRAHRALDMWLGSGALIPIVVCAALAWLVPEAPPLLIRTIAVIWAASLLTFFAGVRRGLTFSEAGGGRLTELATMLAFFGLGVASLVMLSCELAAVGLAGVGLLDAWSARKREAPTYFAVFRPAQMALGAVAMILVRIRTG